MRFRKNKALQFRTILYMTEKLTTPFFYVENRYKNALRLRALNVHS
jgi:hypothetical protein